MITIENHTLDGMLEKTGMVIKPCQRCYFYGLKLHLMVTGSGQPVEFFLKPGSWNDTRALKMYGFDLSDDALVIGDKSYDDYGLEDLMSDENIHPLPLHKKNSLRALPSMLTYPLVLFSYAC